jgi:hypothetical protein
MKTFDPEKFGKGTNIHCHLIHMSVEKYTMILIGLLQDTFKWKTLLWSNWFLTLLLFAVRPHGLRLCK